MMQARKSSRPVRDIPPFEPVGMDRLRACIASLLLDAGAFISSVKVEETARGWLARTEPGAKEPGREMLLVADALGMATDLALFTPSASGQTALPGSDPAWAGTRRQRCKR